MHIFAGLSQLPACQMLGCEVLWSRHVSLSLSPLRQSSQSSGVAIFRLVTDVGLQRETHLHFKAKLISQPLSFLRQDWIWWMFKSNVFSIQAEIQLRMSSEMGQWHQSSHQLFRARNEIHINNSHGQSSVAKTNSLNSCNYRPMLLT